MLEAALALAARGFAIFPLDGKIPFAGSHGHKDATTAPETIRAWWSTHPNADIGIATGAPSGVVVLDIDGPEGELALKHSDYELPETLEARTGKGRHLYFIRPGVELRNFAGRLPKIDMRADGGYVVAPPSRHVDGDGKLTGRIYEWEDEDATVAPCPLWLIELAQQATKEQEAAKAANSDDDDAGPFIEGQRNTKMFEFACRWRRGSLEYPDILASLQRKNQEVCKPPLGDAEILKIAGSAAHYTPEQDIIYAARAEALGFEHAEKAEDIQGDDIGTLEVEITRRTHGKGRRGRFRVTVFLGGRVAILDDITGSQVKSFAQMTGIVAEEGISLQQTDVMRKAWTNHVHEALKVAGIEDRDEEEDAVGAVISCLRLWVGHELGETDELTKLIADPDGYAFHNAEFDTLCVNKTAMRRRIKNEVPDATRENIAKALRHLRSGGHEEKYEKPDGTVVRKMLQVFKRSVIFGEPNGEQVEAMEPVGV